MKNMIRRIFRIICEITTSEDIKNMKKALTKVPGPSPWYLYKMGPKIRTKYGITSWKYAGRSENKCGKFILKAGNNNLAVFNFYNYVCHLKDSLLLVWNQPRTDKGTTNPIILKIFDCNKFIPIDNLENIYPEMKEKEILIYHKNGVQDKFEIPTTNIDKSLKLYIPDSLREMDEILILAHSSALAGWTWDRNNLCLLSLKPKTGTCDFYPQDWFNNGGYDYGYEWVTHVAREPKSQKICGAGVRIKSFILDRTNRKIEKYFY